ncbi:MAG: hypothetical protein LBU04_05740 [Christensenellaceae bacterium]|jgi:IS30 family transposase|nr:hypothetical protein [Christensenellaceae bacterium]
MDTVIGRIGGKVIMTFLFVPSNFMFGILLPDKTALSVANAIKALKARLRNSKTPFKHLFVVILTDNGGEFSCVDIIEQDECGNQETLLYFCDPHISSQKPHVEKNHTLFRDIVVPGSSFDEFNQDTVNLIYSHVNSVKRKDFAGKSAYDVFAFMYGEEAASLLGIDRIPSEEVIQSPKLLEIIDKK